MILRKIGFALAFVLSYSVIIAQLHYSNKELPCLNKTFNVHVHVVLDSLGNTNITADQLDAVFMSASEKFSPICMDFKVCKIDTIRNYNFDSIPTTQELNEISTIFKTEKRLNVFILSDLYITSNNVPQKVCGLGGNNVYLDKECMGSLTHELGHFFGLPHTFEGAGKELVDGSNCETEGDQICDTPADPYIQFDPLTSWIDKDCHFISEVKDANGQYYIPQVGNIMSYYDCPCQEFTRGQFLKMVESYLTKHKDLW